MSRREETLNRYLCHPKLFQLALFVVVLLSACRCGNTVPEEEGEIEEEKAVTVLTGSGSFQVMVEIADDPLERATGLMNRTGLEDDRGMLFVWGENVQESFWMKDTFISLDIFFIDENKKIIFVAEGATPLSTDLITPTGTYRYVLEVKAGFTARTGAKGGDSVEINF